MLKNNLYDTLGQSLQTHMALMQTLDMENISKHTRYVRLYFGEICKIIDNDIENKDNFQRNQKCHNFKKKIMIINELVI